MQEPRGTSAKAAPQQQAPADTELDDDELLDMMGDMQPEPCLDSGPPVSSSMQPPLNDTLPGEVHAWSLDLSPTHPVVNTGVGKFCLHHQLGRQQSMPCCAGQSVYRHMHADLLSTLT